MKRYLSQGLIALLCFFLMGCATNRTQMLNTTLADETWMREVNTQSQSWLRGADRWFMSGDANAVELANRHAPPAAAMTTMNVRVADFNAIKVIGDYEVQIFGTHGPNSVYVYGPNNAARQVAVEVRGHTLCITQAKNAPRNMRRVIIRIGVNNLTYLMHNGCGRVEGIWLNSTGLTVVAYNTGNIYLRGQFNLQRVMQYGSGAVNIFPGMSPCVDIQSLAGGCVNINGPVGLRKITHRNRGDINVIGAYKGPAMRIFADGKGKIGINGTDINLYEVIARGQTRVYIYSINTPAIYAYAYDQARIGLAGHTNNLYVDTSNYSVFNGRYLCVYAGYVRAYDKSHINVAASEKIFASATQNASVYFFGSPTIMSQFVSGSAIVIPIWGAAFPSCPIMRTVYVSPRASHPVARPRVKRVGQFMHYKAEALPGAG